MLTKEYREKLRAQLQGMKGDVAMYYKNLETGETFGYRENDPLQPASVIKLPVFLRYLQLWVRGEIDPKEELTVTDADRIGGCGALRAFHGEQRVSLETLWELMITLSDNAATNLLIRRLGREELNRAFREEMGLTVTRINRLLFDSEAASRGIENEISAKEMGMLLQQIWRREFASPEMSEYAEEILARQQINHKIPGYISDWNVRIAHKTGEDDGIANDVGLVYAKQPFVVCYASTNTCERDFEILIRQSAWDIFRACGGAPEE
ncbi:MAG: class A beta-lactamase-related serine hydrolase [Clostridia bacterium]|nr:class A beta-lactamase-related serine hydrolase [Clostridia bacterium]